MTDAVREGEQYHQCVCLVVQPNGVKDKCYDTAPMDQAFCDICEEAGHHLLPEGVEVVMPERSNQ